METAVTVPEEEPEGYISISEAADRRGVTVDTLYKVVRQGKIPSIKLLGKTGVLYSDVEAYPFASWGGVKRAQLKRGHSTGRPKKGEKANAE